MIQVDSVDYQWVISSTTDEVRRLNAKSYPTNVFVPIMADEWDNDVKSYHGQEENQKPNGFGTMILFNNVQITGVFKDGFPNGQVIINFPDGNMYAGETRDGKLSGHGVYFYPRSELGHNSFQFAYWEDGVPNGMTILTDNIGRHSRKEFLPMKGGETSGKGMIAIMGPGGTIVPGIFEEHKGDRKWPDLELSHYRSNRD